MRRIPTPPRHLISALVAWPMFVLGALLAVPEPQAVETVPARGVVILMYHRFGEDAYPATSIRLEQFEAHLAELRKPQYTVLPVPEIVAALRAGRTLPPRTVGITMDDAYRSIYTEAWPRLRRAGFPFTVFVATEPLDRGYRDMMGWEQLREMAAAGSVSIGNHTVTHPHMPDQGTLPNRREVQAAQRRIAEQTGVAPGLFAYPYGEFGLVERKLVEKLGFAAAFGQHSGAIGPAADWMTLPRFAMNAHYGTPERFLLVVNALPLPVRDVIPADRLLTAQTDPPLFGFTLPEGLGDPGRVTCYVGGQTLLEMRRIGRRRLEGRPTRALGPGRSRINCTLPGPQGRWHWFGVQFYRPGS